MLYAQSLRFCVFFVGASALSALSQDAPLSAARLPLRAQSPRDFVPRGWKIERQINGDLNRDQMTDAALVLVEDKPAKDVDGAATGRSRALVVALHEKNGWRRVGFNNSLLLGTRDGGALYGAVETPVHVSIRRGVLLVQQESGSRDVLNTTHRFRFDRRRNGLVLVGFDSIDQDRLNGDVLNTSANYLTGVQNTRTTKGVSRTTLKRVSRKLRPIESVKASERDSN